MTRLVSMPNLPRGTIEFLNGPDSQGYASEGSLTNKIQSSSSPFGIWSFRLSFPRLKGDRARAHRGWITQQRSGVNWTRIRWCDFDRISEALRFPNGVPDGTWNGGEAWNGGGLWKVSPSHVALTAAASRGDTLVTFANSEWGYNLDVGSVIGFGPFYFGWHIITEVIGSGQYRIWPELRKDLTTDNYGNFDPIMCCRLAGPGAANLLRGPSSAEGLSATFMEVPDYHVRQENPT